MHRKISEDPFSFDENLFAVVVCEVVYRICDARRIHDDEICVLACFDGTFGFVSSERSRTVYGDPFERFFNAEFELSSTQTCR